MPLWHDYPGDPRTPDLLQQPFQLGDAGVLDRHRLGQRCDLRFQRCQAIGLLHRNTVYPTARAKWWTLTLRATYPLNIYEQTRVYQELWEQKYRARCFEKACFVSIMRRRYIVEATEVWSRLVIDWGSASGGVADTYTGPNTCCSRRVSRSEVTYPFIGPFL